MSEENEIPGDEPVMTGEILPEGQTEEAATAPEPSPAPEPDPAPEASPEPAPEPEPDRHAEKVKSTLNRRFGELTAKAREEAAARQSAEGRLAAAEELIRKLGGEVPAKDAAKPLTTEELRAQVRADMEREEAGNAFNARCNEVFEAGKKAFADFPDAVTNLQMLGVIRPDDSSFLTAVLEADAPEKVLHALSRDPEEAIRISTLPPVRQAAALVKLSVKLATPAPPKPNPVSAAPAPIEPIGGATDKGFDPFDDDLSTDEWIAEMDKREAIKRKREAERGY